MPRVSSKVHPTQTSESADAPVPAPLERTSSRKKMIEEDSGPEGVLVFRQSELEISLQLTPMAIVTRMW